MAIKQQKATISWLTQDMFLEKSENPEIKWVFGEQGLQNNLGQYNRS